METNNVSSKVRSVKMKKFIPKFTLKYVRYLLLFVVLTVIVFAAGYAVGLEGFKVRLNSAPEAIVTRELPLDKKAVDFSLFWRVWDTLESSYYDQEHIVESNMVYGAIKGMVAGVGDPYTTFLTPRENDVAEEDLSGSFSGVGIQIGFKGSQLAVVAPLPDSPAEIAGILAGDFIVGIKDDNRDIDRGTVGITLPEAVQSIRGPEGSIVTLALLREESDTPIIVDLVRKNIEVPSVILSYVGENEDIAHAQILRFGAETKDEFDEVVLDMLSKVNLRGVIIDVRNNPGGYLQGAIDLASEFLDTGELVVIEERGDKTQEYVVEKIGRLTDENVVVLINKGSASASEILAGALRDQRGTKLVGEISFGKGTIQDRQELEGGVALHMTVARWLTPDRFWVNDGGLVPDYELEDDQETKDDEQLLRAISVLES